MRKQTTTTEIWKCAKCEAFNLGACVLEIDAGKKKPILCINEKDEVPMWNLCGRIQRTI